MTKGVTIPGIADLLWTVLKAMRDLGGSASRAELLSHVREVAGLTEEQLAVVFSGSTGKSKALYRAEWAIYWLRAIGVLDSSRRGVYATTSRGAEYFGMDVAAADLALRSAYDEARKQAAKKAAAKRAKSKEAVQGDDAEPGAANDLLPDAAEGDGAGSGPVSADDWRIALLETLKTMTPAAFERLAKRILREAGFQKVDVVGRVGDGGIDGVGLYKMSLVSFPIYFQCKRYAGSVGASVVRDFRGAMAGRGDKGLIITTGTFTPAAREEATRDGAPPVDLIDGDELCDLILDYRLGVSVVERTVRDITVDGSFFETL